MPCLPADFIVCFMSSPQWHNTYTDWTLSDFSLIGWQGIALQAVQLDQASQLLQVLDGWVHLALAMLPLMDAAAVKGKILLFAAARCADREMGAQGRLLCAALLGAAAQKLPREDVELDCLPKIIALCQVGRACIQPYLFGMHMHVLISQWALA